MALRYLKTFPCVFTVPVLLLFSAACSKIEESNLSIAGIRYTTTDGKAIEISEAVKADSFNLFGARIIRSSYDGGMGTFFFESMPTKLSGGLFTGAANLESVILPQTVSSIGDSAFEGCSSLSMTLEITEAITSIGSSAFKGCSSIKSICPKSLTPIDIGTHALPEGAKIYVRYSSLANYKSHWPEYAGNMVELPWLSKYEDDLPLCKTTLPGAHDAATGTYTGVLSKYCRAQEMSVSGLVEAGVRVFDFRPAVKRGALEIFHGAFDMGVSFNEAMTALLDFLSKNPTEFAVVLVRHESEADGNSAKWATLMENYCRSISSVTVRYSPYLTVGDIRGKVLILSRQDYIGCSRIGWRELCLNDKYTSGDYTFYIQDYYNPKGKDDKLNAVENLMTAYQEFSADPSDRSWCINFAAGCVSSVLGLPSYQENANNVNAEIAEYVKSQTDPLGMIMMDFAGVSSSSGTKVCGDRLLDAIINYNH